MWIKWGKITPPVPGFSPTLGFRFRVWTGFGSEFGYKPTT